ncbi:MAG: hypothetical protein QOE61_4826 [Micromonosporaceae bacterium]|jgi:4-amino-4-deoxy-L-arabinose transferase-like glycosyltransferase|nr:hypothetical protein [Micromonosporaceae bacterium]
MPWRSPEDQPGWARPVLLALAAASAALYGWRLNGNGLHEYYAPAVKSMSVSWKAFLYGGYDPAASITLDKLPGAFMVQALSARIFGFHTWSVILPQVIASVVTVLVLYRVVRRWRGPVAGMFAAAAYATMPIVAALARAQISDTLLVMLLVLAADAWQRAVGTARLRSLLLCGLWVGLAFQTKMVQAWGVLPAFALVYLVAAPGMLRRRLAHVGLAGLVTVAVSMWWIVLVLLTPTSSRPYVDGSTDNSPLSMVFGYNLLDRYRSGDGAPPGGLQGIDWGYLLGDGVAPQVGWLYPLALVGLVVGVWWRGRASRTDPVRAGFLMWGCGWPCTPRHSPPEPSRTCSTWSLSRRRWRPWPPAAWSRSGRRTARPGGGGGCCRQRSRRRWPVRCICRGGSLTSCPGWPRPPASSALPRSSRSWWRCWRGGGCDGRLWPVGCWPLSRC